MPAMMNESTIAGPACWAAARPVSTKMPVPMMPPMPIAVSATGPSDLRSSPLSLSAARSCDGFRPRAGSSALTGCLWRPAALTIFAGAASCAALDNANASAQVNCAGWPERAARAAPAAGRRPWACRRRCRPPVCIRRRSAVPTMPPASVISSVPAAVSHGDKPDLPECVQPARRDISQIERRRARAANAGGLPASPP